MNAPVSVYLCEGASWQVNEPQMVTSQQVAALQSRWCDEGGGVNERERWQGRPCRRQIHSQLTPEGIRQHFWGKFCDYSTFRVTWHAELAEIVNLISNQRWAFTHWCQRPESDGKGLYSTFQGIIISAKYNTNDPKSRYEGRKSCNQCAVAQNTLNTQRYTHSK